MADPAPTTVLATTEAIVVDGANGVTTAPRQHFPDGAPLLVVFVVAAVAARLARRPHLVAAALLLAAVPGLVHVLGLRADAPLARPASTAPIARVLAELHSRAPWPATPVKLTREDDDLFPLGRYAFPSRPERPGTPIEVELRSGPLANVTCREDHVRLLCGAGP